MPGRTGSRDPRHRTTHETDAMKAEHEAREALHGEHKQQQ